MFRVLWLSIKDLFDELFVLIGANFIWFVMSMPLLAAAGALWVNNAVIPGLLVAMLGVLPLGPATAGLFTLAERVHDGRTISIGNFFAGVRANARLSWKVYGVWMAGFLLILTNARFYSGLGSTIGLFLQIFLLYLLLIWVALLIYVGPLMLLQTDKSLRLIARNAALMVLGRPIFTLITLVMMLVFFGISAVLGVVLLPALVLFSFLAVWSFRATTKLIADAEARRLAAEEKASGEQNRYSTDKGRSGQIRPRD